MKPVDYNRTRADNAFEVYWSMGETRTQRQVANRLKIGLRAVEEYSKKYNWSQKIAARLELAAQAAQEASIAAIRRQRPQIAIGLHNALKRFFDKNPSAEDWSQFDTVIKNLRLELGEPTDHQKRDENWTGNLTTEQRQSNEDLFVLVREYAPELEKELNDALNRLIGLERKILEAKASRSAIAPPMDA
jgi:hypothetical protein